MKKIVFMLGMIAFLPGLSNGQSINNRDWKAYFPDPFNDTLTLHIHSDSSFVTNGKGELMLNTNCIIDHDTLTLSDYNTSEHACPDMPGKYKISMDNTGFTMVLISDACEGRARALQDRKWVEAKK